MTEFSYIGGHCAFKSCNKYDFLPFKCEGCKKDFCGDHRMMVDHNCPFKGVGNKSIPICPLCGQKIPVGADASDRQVNVVMDRHIQSGCPSVKKRKVDRCNFQGCNNKGFLKCSYCGILFCSTHRLSFDHNCKKEKYPQKKRVKKPIRRTRKRKEVKKKKIRKVKSYQSVYHRINFKNPGKPIGNPNIDRKDQFYLDVFYSPDLKRLGRIIEPRHMFFNKSWKIGKVLDRIAAEGEVENKNYVESDPSKQLNLFNLMTGFNLPVTDTLEKAQQLQMIRSTDPVVLVKGHELPRDFQKSALKMLNDNNNKCNVM